MVGRFVLVAFIWKLIKFKFEFLLNNNFNEFLPFFIQYLILPPNTPPLGPLLITVL